MTDTAANIIVIDDSPDDRMLYRRTLQKVADKSYSVTEAGDGEEGLCHLDADNPVCVLLDYSLPGHNGIEVLKQIRGKHPFVPVVMLTGQGNENVAVAAMQEGAQNYILKSTITAEILDHVIQMATAHCKLQKRIHEQRTSLEVFTHALAHDLKEPIRTIRSFVELIARNETFPDKTKHYFQHIENAADRMHMLIDTVFHYTRLDDPVPVAREICDTGSVLQGALENLDKLIRERAAVITSAAPLPHIYANRMQLMQVLQNLISNAIHHSAKAVTIHVYAQEQDQWTFGVRDNGPGIDTAYFHKIFEPFKRLSHQESQGAGLGLATCKKIVESHGGRIWCESKLGEGTTFLFTLPKQPLDTARASDATDTSTPRINAAVKDEGKPLASVLLVDDSPADLEITQFRLVEVPKLRCNFLIAHGGEEALAILSDLKQQGNEVDLMLLDINMPEMGGFEVLERIRANSALNHIPVVMCTGSTYDKDMQHASQLGAIAYLTKPVSFQQLKDIVSKSDMIELCEDNSGYNLVRAA